MPRVEGPSEKFLVRSGFPAASVNVTVCSFTPPGKAPDSSCEIMHRVNVSGIHSQKSRETQMHSVWKIIAAQANDAVRQIFFLDRYGVSR